MQIFQDIIDRLTYPARCNCAIGPWFAFLVLVLIVSFLWSTVVKQIE